MRILCKNRANGAQPTKVKSRTGCKNNKQKIN